MTASKRQALSTSPTRNKGHGSPSSVGSSSAEETSATPAGVDLTVAKKNNKPLMEKRRRARINKSLAILKDLVVESDNNANKLEKADILELTVNRVRELCDFETRAQEAFQNGHQKCLETASQFLVAVGLEHLTTQLVSHVTSSGTGPIDVDTSMMMASPEDLLNEPINLAVSSCQGRDLCSAWRPW